jgi:hypothetical protein
MAARSKSTSACLVAGDKDIICADDEAVEEKSSAA